MRFLLIFYFYCLAFPLFASVHVDRISKEEMIIRFEIDNPVSRKIKIEGSDYIELKTDDWELPSAEGVPLIPYKRIQIWIPERKNLKTEILSIERSAPLLLSAPPAYSPFKRLHSANPERAKKNIGAYQKAHGTSAYYLEETSFAGTDKIATLRIQPIEYVPSRRTLRYVTSAKIRITFDTQKGLYAQAPISGKAGKFARYIAVNGDTSDYSSSTPMVDLVIAHSSYQMFLQRYLDLKREWGHEVREYYVSGLTNQKIKDLITLEYKNKVPPTSTLLVGSIDQLPSWRGSSDNTWTDFPYQNLDTGTEPDISLGRIPAQNSTELNNFIEKVIARELSPRNNADILATSGQDTSFGCPNNVVKVGENIQAGDSSIKLIKKLRTQVSTQEVIDGYNQGPNVIIYDGHGDRQGMREIPLIISGLTQLKNNVFPLILDIACLNANWTSSGANPRNFAESILFMEKKGSAGIMASGGSGDGHEFFRSIGTLLAKARTTSDPLLNQIGHSILLAKIQAEMQDRSYWNYYGDPSTTVWESP